MNKLLKNFGLILLITAMLSCTSAEDTAATTSSGPAISSAQLLLMKMRRDNNAKPDPIPEPEPVIWGAEEGETFVINRTYDATTPGAETLNFDFTGLGANDSVLANIDSIESEFLDNLDAVLLTADVLINNDVATWTISDDTPDTITRADVAADIYNQTFVQTENVDLAFANAQQTISSKFTVTDDKYVYVLDGVGGDIIDATVMSVDEL